MTPAVICIDPSMAAIGWAVGVQAPTLAESVVAFGVEGVGRHGEQAAAANTAFEVQRVLVRRGLLADTVAIERPAGGMRADYGPRSQAEAAEGPAWVGGLCCAHIEHTIGAGPLHTLRPRSYDWRPAMEAAAALAGFRLAPDPDRGRNTPTGSGGPMAPSGPTAGGGARHDAQAWAAARWRGPPPRVTLLAPHWYRLTWPSCGHSCDSRDVEARIAAGCPVCAGAVMPGSGQGQDHARYELPRLGLARTDDWKAKAWRFAQGARPDIAGALLADAESRARTPAEPWERVGVADACEAAGMVPWALKMLAHRLAVAPAAMLGSGAR